MTGVSHTSRPYEGLDSDAYDSFFKFLKVWDPTLIRPVDEINLFAVIPSGSASDTVLQVASGSGADTLTVKYIPPRKIAWVESMGLLVEFTSTGKNITWETATPKYIRILRRRRNRSGAVVEWEARFGGFTADELDNWRMIDCLAEMVRYHTGVVAGKDWAKYDFVAFGNNHYWFPNLYGDEYIRLVADAGIFTYTDDVACLYIHGLVFDLDDILKMT